MKTQTPAQHPVVTPTSWDIFCRVIDNHGDLGVCWRLGADLAQRGHTVRLWVDDASALSWMAPMTRLSALSSLSSLARQNTSVQVMRWQDHPQARQVHDVVVEAFGCALPEHIQSLIAKRPDTRWINLEYLSAEPYVVRQHGLPSPVMSGPAKGHTKWFFYPGFTPGTGGLLREPDVQDRQARFDKAHWLRQLAFDKPIGTHERLISLFCYEPEPLKDLLQHLAQDETPTRLLVTAGRAQQAVTAVLPTVRQGPTSLTVEALPYLSQTEFDHLLWASDMNFVRGEDSLVRAIWAGKPWVWQIYPQDDQAHHTKLQALCECLQMPADLQTFQYSWNQVMPVSLPQFTLAELASWGNWSQQTSLLLQKQPDLITQLLDFMLNFTSQKR